MSPDPMPYTYAVFTRGILYGLYIATLITCFRWLLIDDEGRGLRKVIHWRLVSITIFIFLFLTTSVGITIQITRDLIKSDHSSARLALVKVSFENTGILITNAVLIYRCWVVYTKAHRWIVLCPPLILWFSGMTCSILIVYLYSGYVRDHPEEFLVYSRLVSQSRPCWLGFYSCDIAINLYVTCGIIYRIRSVATGVSTGSRQLYYTCKILAQFGALYTVTSILSLSSLLFDTKPHLDVVRFCIDAANFLMPGITFNLILIRVHQERAKISRLTEEGMQMVLAPLQFRASQTQLSDYPKTTNER